MFEIVECKCCGKQGQREAVGNRSFGFPCNCSPYLCKDGTCVRHCVQLRIGGTHECGTGGTYPDTFLYSYSMANLLAPICAKCNKLVDKIEHYRDLEHAATVYRVYCHGAVETTSVPDSSFLTATSVEFGMAFREDQKQIGEP